MSHRTGSLTQNTEREETGYPFKSRGRRLNERACHGYPLYLKVAARSSLIREYVDVSSCAMSWEKAMPADGNCRIAFKKAILGINAA